MKGGCFEFSVQCKSNVEYNVVSNFLDLCCADQEGVTQSIVMSDETMVFYYNLTSKRDSMEWHWKGEAV